MTDLGCVAWHALLPILFVQGKGIILTSDIGNVRHPFKCRDRTSLLAAFAELQVRERYLWHRATGAAALL